MKKFEQDDEEVCSNGELGYFQKVLQTTILTVPIDEPIQQSRYYRQVVSAISELSEDDEIHFKISSPGGLLGGLQTLLAAINQSPATSVAFIESDCHSAASILALNCDAVAVSEFGHMLVHFVSFGSAGPSNHVIKHAEHIRKISEKLFRSTYRHFLTEEEMTKCIEDDYQLWLDAEEIQRRFEFRVEMLMKEHELLDAIEEEEFNSDEDPEFIPPEEVECDCGCGYSYSSVVAEPEYDPDEVAFKPKRK